MEISFFKKYLKILIPITFFLIALGGAVRAMHAGLSCPDWPLCFGKVIPDYQLQVYYEFIHRVIAGIVGVATFVLTVLIFLSRKVPRATRKTLVVANIILLTQIVLGGLTVLHLLRFEVVTMHLLFGMLFLSSLLWLYFQLEDLPRPPESVPPAFSIILGLVLFMVLGQIILGGMVSSNYAGLACDGFPLCYGQFFPTFEGIVGLQVIHRGWGYLTAFAILSLFNVLRKNRTRPWMNPKLYSLGRKLLVVIAVQIGVGALNVWFKTPPLITVVHTFMAAVILALILRMFYVGRTFEKG